MTATARKLDQLDVACEMAVRRIRRRHADVIRQVWAWEPRVMPEGWRPDV